MSEQTESRRDPNAVYRVVRLVATDDTSWEAAAVTGIAELSRTITDLRVARVTKLDAVVRGGAIVSYRVRLEASYRIDRRRIDSGTVVTVQRVLVVANDTIGRAAVNAAIAERLATGPLEIHLLAPVNPAGWGAVAALGDPGSGYVPPGPSMLEGRDEAVKTAEDRVRGELIRLRALGATATGEVALDDPADAVARVLERASFDEIIVSTLPSTVSRWLRLDLARRLQRRFGVPVVEIINA